MEQLFSNEEKLDLLEYYFKNNRNATTAINSYVENFPERRRPQPRYFRKLVINLLNFGSFEKPRPKKYSKENQNRNAAIVEYFTENPSSSTRKADNELAIPKSTIHRVLDENKFHPYKATIVQGLQEGDYQRRVAFCNWYIQQCNTNPAFQYSVIWTDETKVNNCGIFNRHNHHFWGVNNPHALTERRLQVRFGFNVWCGIIGKIIL